MATTKRSFIGGYSLGAEADKYAAIQLLNPSGSGKVVQVDSVTISSATSSVVNLSSYGTALPNESATTKTNTFVGGTAPAADIYYDGADSEVGTEVGFVGLLENQPVTINFKRPITLSAAAGFAVVDKTVNTTLVATFEWREVDDGV